MGFDEPELHESDAEVIASCWSRSRAWSDFARAGRRGRSGSTAEPGVQFADLRFPTPSGRIEIASAARRGRRAPARARSRSPTRAPAAGRLRLLTPASPWMLNDSFANDPKIAQAARGRRRSRCTPTTPPRAVSPTATGRACSNAAGSAAARPSRCPTACRAGVAYSPKGRWPKREPERANVNALNPGIKSDMGGSTAVHGVEVTVTAAS